MSAAATGAASAIPTTDAAASARGAGDAAK